MEREKEYIEFWLSINKKVNEIMDDYEKLSDENKKKVNSVKDAMLRAHTFFDMQQILESQIGDKS